MMNMTSRLREALQFLLEVIKYENLGRGQQLPRDALVAVRRNEGGI